MCRSTRKNHEPCVRSVTAWDTVPEDVPVSLSAWYTRAHPLRMLSCHACFLKISVITGKTLITEYSGFSHQRNLSSNLLLNVAFLSCIKNICLALCWTLSQKIILFKAQGNHFPLIL